MLVAAGVRVVDFAGYEGDDIIATIAERLTDDDQLLIVTGDRDSYQLVRDPQVRVLYNKRGVSDYALYDEAGILERTGVTPDQYADYAALRGDPSDNLDGVPGVGEKTAAKLINAYGSLEAVFDHADEQTPKLRESLHASRERVLRNAELMKLVRNVPIVLERSEYAPRPDVTRLAKLFDRLEFSSMLSRWKPLLKQFGVSEAVGGDTRKPFVERYIHGEIYRTRPEVMAIVHSHAMSVIPFGITGAALRPVYHMGSFLHSGAPVWDIRDKGGDTDMLVSNRYLGRA
ncbi:MAG: hypothetical protein EBR63_03430, partial [Actinobacteria bacterium]|nr:hypothetical protein [Actinomycetota bacterium]